MEQVFKLPEDSTWHPFSEWAKIRYRGYSLPLQRKLTDFGEEKSFARAAAQVREHYGIEVSATTIPTIRTVSRAHGQALQELTAIGKNIEIHLREIADHLVTGELEVFQQN